MINEETESYWTVYAKKVEEIQQKMVWYALFILMVVLTGFFILVLLVAGLLNDDNNSWVFTLLVLQVIVGTCIGILIGLFWKIRDFKDSPKASEKPDEINSENMI
jgi:uncharacterized protein YneF (UPF0154 family)